VRLIAALCSIFPLRYSVKLGGLLGIAAFDLLRIRRSVTLGNLERALGSRLDARERVRVGRRSYVNFAKSMIEFASIGRLKRETIRSIVAVNGIEYIEQALSRGRGVVAVTGHFGSWELLGAASVAYGLPADFLVGEQSNRLVDDMMNRLRSGAGIGIIARGIAARGVFASLKKNRIVALLSDQDAKKAGIFVDFFGAPASTYPGAAQFAHRMDCPIVFCYIVRRPDETHEAFFEPPIDVRRDADRDAEAARLTEEHVRALERCVTRYPDHYFWAHRRWKTKRPPDGRPRGAPAR
jgi:KDO2-lipid IV(A) lauroyltransferase